MGEVSNAITAATIQGWAEWGLRIARSSRERRRKQQSFGAVQSAATQGIKSRAERTAALALHFFPR
jgi:hypothetical protein